MSESGKIETKTILVTGGTGLVGRAIQKVIKEDPKDGEQFIFLSSKDVDLRKACETRACFEKYRPTHVIHLAAKVGGLFDNMKHNLDYYRENAAINENVLHNSFEFHVTKVVSCLSVCIFPEKCVNPVDETMVHEGPPHPINFGYSHAKRMIDVQNRAYYEQHGCQFTSVIPTNIYGPYDNYNLEVSHVIPGLIHKAYIAKKENKPLVVCGTGEARRQFIYSEDLAKLFLWVMREYEEIAPIVLSVDETHEVSIGEVAQIIADAYHLEKGIIWDSAKSNGKLKMTASNHKLRKYLPDFEFSPLRETLTKTVDWFIHNYDIARK